MKKLVFLLLLLPFCSKAQKVNDIIERVAMIQFMAENPNGQLIFRQTKSWCTNFLDLNENQSSTMNELFNKQYTEIVNVYKEYSVAHSPESLKTLIGVIVSQEENFRKLLTASQLALYKTKTAECKIAASDAKNKAFNNLFFSDEMLVSYRQ